MGYCWDDKQSNVLRMLMTVNDLVPQCVLAGAVMQLARRHSDVILATDVTRGLVHNKRALADTRGLVGFAPAAVVWFGGWHYLSQFSNSEATSVGKACQDVVLVQ